MSEKSREQISALMDGEQETGSVFILSAMSSNEEFRHTWNRYHLIGDVLRGHLSEKYYPDFANHISSALEKESAYSPVPSRASNLLKPVAGFAIAASVAVVAILGVRQVGVTPGQAPAELVADSQPVTAPVVQDRPSANPAADNITVAHPDYYQSPVDARSRLNRYLVNYNEYRTNAGVQGMLPYVRIVAHEVEE